MKQNGQGPNMIDQSAFSGGPGEKEEKSVEHKKVKDQVQGYKLT